MSPSWRTTLGISVLNNIRPLRTRTQNYHLKVSQCGALNIIIYIIFEFKKTLMLRNSIELAFSGRDTLRLPCI